MSYSARSTQLATKTLMTKSERRINDVIRFASANIILGPDPESHMSRDEIYHELESHYFFTRPNFDVEYLGRYSEGQLMALLYLFRKYITPTNVSLYSIITGDSNAMISGPNFRKYLAIVEAAIEEENLKPIPEPFQDDQESTFYKPWSTKKLERIQQSIAPTTSASTSGAPPRPGLPPPVRFLDLQSLELVEIEIRRVKAIVTGLQETLDHLEVIRDDLIRMEQGIAK